MASHQPIPQHGTAPHIFSKKVFSFRHSHASRMMPHHHHHHGTSNIHHHRHQSHFVPEHSWIPPSSNNSHPPPQYSVGPCGYLEGTFRQGFPNPHHHHHGHAYPWSERQPPQRTVLTNSPPRITPHENDVLMGRGGRNNQHSGNEKLRQIARGHCTKYKASTKKGKSTISRKLVQQMRNLCPPARFLKRDSDSGDWSDVGDDIAREKASQVLRDAVAQIECERVETELTEQPSNATHPNRKPFCHEPGSHPSTDPVNSRPFVVPATTQSVSASASLPPPSPLENNRKRHRPYFSEDDALFFQAAEDNNSSMDRPSQRRRYAPNEVSDRDSSSSKTASFRPIESGPPSPARQYCAPYESLPFDEDDARLRNSSSSRNDFAPPPTTRTTMTRSPVPEGAGRTHGTMRLGPQSSEPCALDSSSSSHRLSGDESGCRRPLAVSVAARQASVASCGSALLMLGDIGTLLSDGSFDLLNGDSNSNLAFSPDDAQQSSPNSSGEGNAAVPSRPTSMPSPR